MNVMKDFVHHSTKKQSNMEVEGEDIVIAHASEYDNEEEDNEYMSSIGEDTRRREQNKPLSLLKRTKIIKCGEVENESMQESDNSYSASNKEGTYDDDNDEDDEDVSLSMVNGKKKNKSTIPSKGRMVRVQYVARQGKDRSKIISTSRDKDRITGKSIGGNDEPIRFELMRFDDEEDDEYIEDDTVDIARGLPKALHFAVTRMSIGEISEFAILHPSIGWSSIEPRGRGKAVFCKPEIESEMVYEGYVPISILEIELVSFEAAKPRYPSQKSLEKTREEYEKEERKKARDYPPPTVKERIEMSNKCKNEGNELFKKKDYEFALEKYATSFVYIFYTADDWEMLKSDEEKKMILESRRILHLNRSICKLKLEMYEDAEWDCDKAIELSEEVYKSQIDAKPFFRRSLVIIERLKDVLKLEQKKKYWDIDEANEMYKQASKDLEQAESILKKSNQTIDSGIENNKAELEKCKKWLIHYEKQYNKQRKDMVQQRMFKSTNQSKATKNTTDNEIIEAGNTTSTKNTSVTSAKNNEVAATIEDDDIPELED